MSTLPRIARSLTMDAARKFPSYTLAELKKFVANHKAGIQSIGDPARVKMMEEEIAAREAGTSVQKVTPQVPWK